MLIDSKIIKGNIQMKKNKFSFVKTQLFIAILLVFFTLYIIGLTAEPAVQLIYEQAFNFLKIIGGLYMASIIFKNRDNLHVIAYSSFLTFNLLVPVLAIYNTYNVFVFNYGVDFTLNISYHLAVLILYLGEYWLFTHKGMSENEK